MSKQYHFRVTHYNKATVKFPFAFFTDFRYLRYSQDAINAFYPDSKENCDEYHNLCWYHKDEINMSFKVDYSIQKSTDDPNWDETVVKTVTYRLEDLYTTFLNERTEEALYFLDEHIDQTIKKSSVKNYLERMLGQMFAINRRILIDDQLGNFRELFSNAIKQLILVAVARYTNYNLNLSIELKNFIISNENTAHLDNLYGSIKINIGAQIFDLKDENNQSLFNIVDRGIFVRSFVKFVTDNFDNTTEKIDFPNRIEAAYYLIYKVSRALHYNSSKIVKSDIFTFKGEKFSVSMYHKTATDYRKVQHKYKVIIDSIF
jgi:hypothetical protein